jgi:hypothetical protein
MLNKDPLPGREHGTHLRIQGLLHPRTVEPRTAPALRGVLVRETGFASVVEIFGADAAVPSFTPLRLTDEGGLWFGTPADTSWDGLAWGNAW